MWMHETVVNDVILSTDDISQDSAKIVSTPTHAVIAELLSYAI